MVRSPDFLRALIRETALATLIHQRRLKLKGVPIPPSDIREKVRSYVQGLTWPTISGIGVNEALTVQWPTGLHALMAFLQPDVLVDRLMVEINRIANTPCPPAQREQRIAKLEEEIDLCLPKIISGRNGGAVQTRSGWLQ